ncbi:MAG: hypothetical protein AAGC60_20495 [Acidobacteriota bacterium]
MTPSPPIAPFFRPGARRLCLAAVLVLGLLSAGPLLGYVVVLKDGSQITTQKAPTVDGERVILVLQNGTQAFYRASEVDFEKTEALNADANLSNARVLEGFRSGAELDKPEPPEEAPSFAELASRRQQLTLPDRQRRPERADDPAIELPYTRAGFIDLLSMERQPLGDDAVVTDIQSYLKSQGHEDIRVWAGSAADRPFIELTAASEASVFKGLKDVANCLVQMRDRHPNAVSSFDLLMLTDARVRAGQFTLTAEMANLLATDQMEPPDFFVQYVEF